MVKRVSFFSQVLNTLLEFSIMDSVLEFLWFYFLELLHCFKRFLKNGGSSKAVLREKEVNIKESMEEKEDFYDFVCDLNDGVGEKEDENKFLFTFKFPTFEEFSKNQKNFSEEDDVNEVLLEASEVDSGWNDGVLLDECATVASPEGSVHVSGDGFEGQGVSEYSDSPKVSLKAHDHEVDANSNDGHSSEASLEAHDHEADVNSNDGFVSYVCRVIDCQEGCAHVMDDVVEDQVGVSESIDSPEVSLETIKVNLNDGSVSNDCLDFDFQKRFVHVMDADLEDKEVIDEKMKVESLDEKMIGEVEEKEELGTSDDEELHKIYDESVNSYSVLSMDSIGSHNLDSPPSDTIEDEFLSDGDLELELDELEQSMLKKSDFLSEDDFVAKPRNLTEPEGTNANGNEKNFSNDTTNKLEPLWEHQELIEQLKMEIKKVRAIGLPTILEESELPPKIMEELKPWKIEEVYRHGRGGGGGKMTEVRKFYESYRERMRKFDVFSYQKMYAIGFLQLKDPLPSSSSPKSSLPEITTLLSQSFTTNKGKKHENNPTVMFIKELQSDLEVVYVGQMCLSWEILHWQYEKVLDIWESDPRGVRRFNEIYGEFQQFQVLMQRFIEDEPFQGPRIQHYVKNRCVFRNLLQVPVIRDDQLKAKSEFVYDITSDVLVGILEESIRLFWRFVRADKHRRKTPIEFQRPEDSQLYMDLQKDLRKKEKKLKEQLKSGKCILKKLRSCREDDETEDEVLYFFCQVDMKLVSRVLQMCKLTSDQLIWCHNKLSKVSYVNRKIHVEVEPSFLLFPC